MLLIDFFNQIPRSDQKPLAKLIKAGNGGNKVSFTPEAFPQLESCLKFLYTAVTRCCDRLVFFESSRTVSGVSFFQWLDRYQSLVEPVSVGHLLSSETTFMTADEWRVRGIELALSAEGENATGFLLHAARCFDNAGDECLQRRAEAQWRIESWSEKLLEHHDIGEALEVENVRIGKKGRLSTTSTSSSRGATSTSSKDGVAYPSQPLSFKDQVDISEAMVCCLRGQAYDEVLGLSELLVHEDYEALSESMRKYFKVDILKNIMERAKCRKTSTRS